MANEYAIPATLDSVLATSLSDYSKRPVDNVYNKNVLLGVLRDRKRMIDGGASVTYPLIKSDQNNGGFYLGASALNTSQSDAETLLEYKWQNVYEPIMITRDEERSNSGDVHKIVDLAGEKIERSELAIAKRVEQAFSTPVAGANNIVDLETLVNTGTLGTIAGATDTFWQSTVTASGSFAAQGISDLSTGTYTVSSASDSDRPTLYLTNKTIFQYYQQTRLPLERITNGNLTANTGATNLTFLGVPVTYGNYVGSGLLFGLNLEYVDLNVDTATDFTMTDWITPVNQTVKVAFILFRTTGPVTTNRRRHLKLTGITA